MSYQLYCPDCKHDAENHNDHGNCFGSEGCSCKKSVAGLYAAECERQRRDIIAYRCALGIDGYKTEYPPRCADDSLPMNPLSEQFQRELNKTKDQRDATCAERDRYKAALDKIANWDEGDRVGPQFDEPWSAMIARTALDGDK